MNLFVAVVPKNKNRINEYINYFETAVPATIPFSNMEYESKIWHNGKFIAASFSIHAEHVAIRKYVAHTKQEFITFNGLPIIEDFSHSKKPWADILLEKYKNRELNFKSVGGYYNFLLVNEQKVLACNSLTRTEPVYWIENNECIVVGNRASLVYAMAYLSTDFQYNLDALISMCTIGWLAHDLVPFKDVNLLDNGMMIEIIDTRVNLIPYKPFEYNELSVVNYTDFEKQYGSLLDDICHEFIKGIKLFKGFSDHFKINLTGGKDSRLVSALCRAAGLDFATVTSGGPEDRDVIVASEVAKILGVEHTFSEKKSFDRIPVVDIFQMIFQQVRLGDGSSNVFDPCYTIRLKPSVQFTGHGAILKGGYDNLKGKDRPVIENKEMAKTFLKHLNLHNKDFFLKNDAVEVQRNINNLIIDKFFESSFPKENFYHYIHTVYGEPRRTGHNRQASAFGAFQNTPFLNDNALRLAFQIPLKFRKNHLLYYHLLLRLNPKLAKHRLSDSRWKFEETGPLPGTSYDEWKAREPLSPTPKTHQVQSWRHGYDDYLRFQIKDYLLSDKNNKIFEIVDYDKLEKVLYTPGPTLISKIRSVFGIMCSSYLIKNEWVDEKYEKTSYIDLRSIIETTKNIAFITFPKYPLISNNEKMEIIYISDNIAKVNWQGVKPKENMYIQVFDRDFKSLPSEHYLPLSKMPDDTNAININLNCVSQDNITLTLFFMQYDDKTRIKNDYSTFKIHQNYYDISCTFSRDKDAKYYKIALKINPHDVNTSSISFSNMRVQFEK